MMFFTDNHDRLARASVRFYVALPIIILAGLVLPACSIERQIARKADAVINDSVLENAHIGISIFDPRDNKYLYSYNGDKYFVPASNTKIPTCYAAMKYLGDSITAAQIVETDTSFLIIPSGDPTLLHADFSIHPLIDRLKQVSKNISITQFGWRTNAWGSGWAWNDYNESYMAERSAFPIYGNVIRWIQERENDASPAVIYSIPEVEWEVNFTNELNTKVFGARRDLAANRFTLTEGIEKKREISVPFVTNGVATGAQLLSTEIGRPVSVNNRAVRSGKRVYSQHLDSVLKSMMHRSDNYFAEQMLLMVSQEVLGFMSEARMIDTILKNELAALPQRPRWVDGSGLSRYNLFTPNDFIFILNRMQAEFGMERLKVVFPTGNEGTLTNYYRSDSASIFAKTGTLSGVVAISGYLYTEKNRLLLFSVLINNHNVSATSVRRAVERFIQQIRRK